MSARYPAKYDALIDTETWAFIGRSDELVPPGDGDPSVADRRRAYDGLCRAFHAGYPDGVAADDTSAPGPAGPVPIRTYRRQRRDETAVVLYLHGGGYMLGGLDSHDDVCAEICERTGFIVASADYRLAPEHPHPAAFEDALAAFEWVAANYDCPVIACGDSAGGNLSAAVSHATRGRSKRPAGQVLIYPALGGNMNVGSYQENAQAPGITLADIHYYERMRFAGSAAPATDPRAAPLRDEDFSRLPPTVAITAQCDPLADDGPAYVDAITGASGRAVCFEEPGLIHGYLRARHSVKKARESFTRIVEAVTALGYGKWPY